MRNKILQVTVITGIWAASVDARTIQTPLPLWHGYPAGHVHAPLNRFVDDLVDEDGCGEELWEAELWGAGYVRGANDAYGPVADKKNCTLSPETLTCQLPSVASKVPIAELIFGSSTFTFAQSFANGFVGTSVPTNPYVSVSTLVADYTLEERGVFFGGIIGKKWANGVTAGLRVEMPYRDIDVDSQGSDFTGADTPNLYQIRQEIIAQPAGQTSTNTVYAARLDFLSALNYINFDANGAVQPLVSYANANAGGNMTIGGQNVAGGLASTNPPTDDTPGIDVIASVNGSSPSSVRWGDMPQNGPTALNADGSGLMNLQRGRFVTDQNYASSLQGNTTAQSKLWVVPNIDPTTGNLTNAAQAIQTDISNSIADLDPSIITFFNAQGINFNGVKSKGIGDIDTEWYLGYLPSENISVELQFGVRFPTGRRIQNVLNFAQQPLGNNGHFELRPGLVLVGHGCCGWLTFKADMTYSFVLKARELLSAPLTGATVSNIGPQTSGQVSWQYFLGDIDITFANPCNPCVGVTVAYQPYVKKADKVCIECPTIVDFTGALQQVDSSILVKNTKRIAHTIRTELFFDGDCCKLFGGFAQVIAGQNVTRDFDLYLGLRAAF